MSVIRVAVRSKEKARIDDGQLLGEWREGETDAERAAERVVPDMIGSAKSRWLTP